MKLTKEDKKQVEREVQYAKDLASKREQGLFLTKEEENIFRW